MYFKKLQNELFLTYKRIREIFPIKILLCICSIFYFLGYKARLIFYKLGILKTNKISPFVISIGNLTCGGTGKTPVSIELAKYLTSKGYKTAILSRGYKRKFTDEQNSGNILVSDGEEILTDYSTSGDEPYLIAKNVPKAIVLSGTDRILNAQSAIRLGAKIIILDDGFQYLKLHRDENILIIDKERPFDNGYLLPAGELRELPDSIKRATAIIISNAQSTKDDLTLNKIKNYLDSKPLIEMSYKIKHFKGINIIKTITPNEQKNELQNNKVLAFSGIGNPDSFKNSLTKAGLNITEHLIYADHYNYEFEDINKIVSIAVKNNIENIITTEKDAIKIEPLCEGAPVTFWYSVLEINWNTTNPFEQILTKLKG